MYCTFCNRQINNKGSLAAHEKVCSKNPDKIKYKRSPLAGAKGGCIPWNKGKRTGPRSKTPLSEVMVENSTYARHALKRRLIDDKVIGYECKICGLGPEWNGKPMPLILDHINGINNDNRKENLRFVCSNCDTQLPTYKSRNINRIDKPKDSG